MGMPIPTVLWWSRRIGDKCIARHRGVEVEVPMSARPAIIGLPDHVTEIDYMMGRGDLRVSGQERRSMTGAECEACRAFLDRMAAAARAVFGLEDLPT